MLARRAARDRDGPPEAELVHVLSAAGLALRRGRGLDRALAAGAAAAGPCLAAPMGELVRDIALGVPLEEAIGRARTPAAEPAFSSALWAVLFAVEAGAPAAAVLDRITASLAHSLDLERQFEVTALHGRLSAIVLSALPVLLVAGFLPFRPDLLAASFKSRWGVPLVLVLVVCWALGLALILRISRQGIATARRPADAVEIDLPVLADLLAEGLDLGLEPRGLLARLLKRQAAGELRDRVGAVLAQAELGIPLADALRQQAARTGSKSFERFGALLADCGPGPGSGDALRFLARELRLARSHRLALEAQRTPFLLMLALVFLVFPLTFGLLVVPFVARVSTALGG